MSKKLIFAAATLAGVLVLGAGFAIYKTEPNAPKENLAPVDFDGSPPLAEHKAVTETTGESLSGAENEGDGLRYIQGILIDNDGNHIARGDVLYRPVFKSSSQNCDDLNGHELDLDGQTRLVQSDAQGRITLSVPNDFPSQADACLLLHGSKPGYVTAKLSLGREFLHEVIEIELEKHAFIRGQVHTPRAASVAGATVAAWIAGGSTTENTCTTVDREPLVEVTSSRDGSFRLGVAGDNLFCVQARHPAWSSSQRQIVSAGESLVLVMGQALRLSGQVVDREQRPVSEVQLQLVPDDPEFATGATTEADNEGNFVFDNLDHGGYSLQSLSRDYGIAKPKTLALKAGESLENVTVTVFPSTIVTGRLLDDNGSPLPGVTISAFSPYIADQSTTSTQSNNQGRFTLNSEHRSDVVEGMLAMANEFSKAQAKPVVTAPRLCVSFYHPRFELETVEMDTIESSLDLGRLHMRPANDVVTGVVLNHRDDPTAAELSFRYIDADKTAHDEPPSRCAQSIVPIHARAGEDGTFSVNLVKRGLYEVEVTTRYYKPQRMQLQVDGADSLRIQLR